MARLNVDGTDIEVDNELLPVLGWFPWRLYHASNGTVTIRASIELSRFIRQTSDKAATYTNSGFEIDHIDRNRLNNKADNLRWATRTQNARNKKKRVYKNKRTTSRYIGVHESVYGGWVASIQADGRSTNLGTFETEGQAAAAYNKAAAELHGAFASLNVLAELDTLASGKRDTSTRGRRCGKVLTQKSSSVFKGVYFSKQKSCFVARIKIDGKTKFLGNYDTAKEAAAAYNVAAELAWGPSAYLNPGVSLVVSRRRDSRHGQRAKRCGGSSSYRGVYRERGGKFVVMLCYHGRVYYGGRFEKEEDAATAYNVLAQQLYGDTAILNKIL